MKRPVVWLWLGVVLLAASFARRASAHAVGLSQGEYRVAGAVVGVTYTFAGADLAAALPAVDADRSGDLSARELSEGQAALARDLVDATTVRADGALCRPHLDDASLLATDSVQLRATFACPAPPRVLGIDAAFVGLFGAGHRHLVTVFDPEHERGDESFLLTASQRTLTVDRVAPGRGQSFAAMVWTGVEHILTGYDHLAFLLGLVLVAGRLRALVATVSAFTVAHSITLALAVLHVVTPRSSLVEAGIALSIAYVGVENIFVFDAGARPRVARRRGRAVTGRWRVTFFFGLLHGFGFAAALTHLALPRDRVVPALLAFNVGVELGQLAVLAVVLPLVAFTRRKAWFGDGVDLASAALTLAGLVWFAVRVGR